MTTTVSNRAMGEVSALDHIRIRGARVHNLRDVDLDLPHDKLIVLTGVSGSGKSSLAFDTLFAEGQRRYLESLSTYSRQFINQLQRPDVDVIDGLPPTISIDQKKGSVAPRSTLATITEIADYLRLLFARAGQAHCPQCERPVSQQSPQTIVDQILTLEERRKVMILAPMLRDRRGGHREVFEKICRAGFVRARVDGDIVDASDPPVLSRAQTHDIDAVIDRIVVKDGIRNRLQESVDLALKHGDGTCLVSQLVDENWIDRIYSSKYACANCQISFLELEPRTFSFNSPHGACPDCHGLGYSITADSDDELVEQQLKAGLLPKCEVCNGSRIGPIARSVKLAGTAIHEFTAMTVETATRFVDGLVERIQVPGSIGEFTQEAYLAAASILPDVSSRLQYLNKVGLGYLTLDRAAASLSGGEFQRSRLAACLGSGLIGVCYVLDEPTIGLHPRDTAQMIRTLQELRDQGNTIVVVEHDADLIRKADFLVDLGPGAGREGGNVVAAGRVDEVAANPDSITGRMLRGEPLLGPNRTAKLQRELFDSEAEIQDPCRPLNSGHCLELSGAKLHNLKNVDVRIPLGVFTVVTGVSGSGKTSLITKTLASAVRQFLSDPESNLRSLDRIKGVDKIDRLVEVDQSAIGRSGRSNPATYSKIWDEVRKLFSQTRDARIRGFKARRFSFNAKHGRCPECAGRGTKRIQMHFLPDLFIECEVCRGARFNRQTLAIRFRGKSVADILAMRIDQAAEFFKNVPRLSRMLETFCEVGLGYLCLGQSSLTLSGGEAQRVKLATELSKRGSLRTLFVLDEPTTGLHAADIARLIDVLDRLVEDGNSVLVIEHQLNLIAAADWVIDMGPEGGDAGGRVIAQGSPRELSRHEESHTALALRKHLCPDGAESV